MLSGTFDRFTQSGVSCHNDMKPENAMNRFSCFATALATCLSCLLAGTAHADSYEHEHYRPDKKYHYQNMPSPQYDLDRESMHLQRNHDRLERQQDQLRHRQERAHRDFSRSHDYMRGSRRR